MAWRQQQGWVTIPVPEPETYKWAEFSRMDGPKQQIKEELGCTVSVRSRRGKPLQLTVKGPDAIMDEAYARAKQILRPDLHPYHVPYWYPAAPAPPPPQPPAAAAPAPPARIRHMAAVAAYEICAAVAAYENRRYASSSYSDSYYSGGSYNETEEPEKEEEHIQTGAEYSENGRAPIKDENGRAPIKDDKRNGKAMTPPPPQRNTRGRNPSRKRPCEISEQTSRSDRTRSESEPAGQPTSSSASRREGDSRIDAPEWFLKLFNLRKSFVFFGLR